jgi:hypothetical protein
VYCAVCCVLRAACYAGAAWFIEEMCEGGLVSFSALLCAVLVSDAVVWKPR